MIILRSFIVAFLALAFSAHAEEKSSVPPATQKEDPEGIEPALPWGNVDFDDRGFVRQTLTLSLDYVPEKDRHSGKLPGCSEPFKSATKLGKLTCTKGMEGEMALSSENVGQECYTNPKIKKIGIAKVLEFKGCQSASVLGFKFNPPLRIDIERR